MPRPKASGRRRDQASKGSASGRDEASREPASGRGESVAAAAGTLYVVATPIGNLEDLSPRALRVLKEVSAVLCEDTRVGLRLLSAMGIENRLERCDQHAEPGRIRGWVERLEQGSSFALITDAGTPGISDPGAVLVREAAAAGVEVVPVPGPSALSAFLSVAGFERGSPVFRGFYPRARVQRDEEWGKVSSLRFDSILVWFESPERVADALADLAERAPEARAVAGKEITKRFEAFYRGSLKEVASHIRRMAGTDAARGEWVIGIERLAESERTALDTGAGDWEKCLRSLIACGVSASRAAREVSQRFGVSKKPVYSRAVEISGDENARDDPEDPDDGSELD